MEGNAEQQPEGIRAREKTFEETIADAKSLVELNKKLAQQLKNLGDETDPKSDHPQ